MKEAVSVVGLGKAGLPLAVVIADAGHFVLGVDVSQKVVDMINRGECPVKGEPGLPEMVKKHHGKNLHASSDPVDSSRKTTTHIVIVPLYIDDKYQPDFAIIDSAMAGVGKGLKRGDLVVVETTMPVGTTSNRLRGILERESGLKAGSDFYLAYSPERIMTGFSISRFKEFPKIVGGVSKESTERAFKFYSTFCKRVSKVDNTETAEMTKIAEGVYRDVNIAIANELLKVCEEYGIDFWKMREAANHEYCNILEAGCGVGGHCIPVYPQFIIQDFKKKGRVVPLASAAREVNDGMAEYYFKKVTAALEAKGKTLSGAKVAVVGLAFREGVDETFYTRAKPLVRMLKEGGAVVYGIDPMISDARIKDEFCIIPDSGRDFKGFDCVLVVHKNVEYRNRLLAVKNLVPVVSCKSLQE